MSLDNRQIKQLTIAGAAASVIIGSYLLRSKKEEVPKGVHWMGGSPVANVREMLKNMHRLYDYQVDLFEKADALTYSLPLYGIPLTIFTTDPQNIEYALKGNFKNYVKGPRNKFALSDLLGRGIFTANGDVWKYQRKAASYIFNVKNFRDEFTNVFVNEMLIMSNQILDKAVEEKTTVDFHSLMFKFTLDSFVYLGFGVQLDSLTKKEQVPFAVSFDEVQRICALRLVDPSMPWKEAFTRYCTPWKMSSRDHINIIDTFAAEVIAKRRKEIAEGVTDHKDLLSRFMTTRNENGELLNDTELRDTVLNFIIAGRDTTAQALSWLFYNLCLQPEIEKKILEEINDKITDEDEKDSPRLYEIISEMPYLHAVFYETLRLHPSVPKNQRYALEDDILPDGTVIKAGYYINFHSYALGRSTKVWGPDAKEFKPERWFDEEGKIRREPQGKWLAFHAGPRVCLGQNLATLEALVCVSMLLRRYSFKLAPGQNVTYDVSVTLPMKGSMDLYVEKRSTNA